MLQIKNISKQYKTGDLVQNALKDVSLNFRDNEFVSILGPSGSGKTTLLNIVGGLDRYDSGDLIINNVSTKNYKDRDWDSYRNHTIGFVFQSYNLIPHQTVLSNVELALTIGGISKKERKRRALDALEQVGLREQAHKRPNQMSGGQMQRVAIARALVNNPDILLADEPTGALDTETSVQVMELLKKVAQDRLVIMVTHNPEIAEEYSTRIVRLKDGKIIDDTDAFEPDTKEQEPPKYKNLGKSSMSFFTAMSLSFNNLLTKKGRTVLTSFAGSIGIIGIALILSLSTGFQNYIDKIQEDTLSSYPLSVTSETADLTSALLSMATQTGEGNGEDVVEEKQYITSMFSSIGKNDLKSLKTYLEENEEKLEGMVSLIRYQYQISPMIFTQNASDTIVQLNPSALLASLSGSSSVMLTATGSSVFSEMIDDPETLQENYDVLAGRWPEKYNEVIMVLPEPNGMPDLMVYSLGLRENKELEDMLAKIMAGEAVQNDNEPLQFTYEELMEIPLKVVDATATYRYNAEYDIYESMSNNKEFMQKVYEDALELDIVGVVCAKEGSNSTSLTSGIAYRKDLTEYVIRTARESEIVRKQLENKEINVFSGKRFDDDSEEAGLNFQDMISIDTELLSSAFGASVSEEEIAAMTQGYMGEITDAINADTSAAKSAFTDTMATLMAGMLNEYIAENANESVANIVTIKLGDVDGMVNNYLKKETSQAMFAQLEQSYMIPKATFESIYAQMLKGTMQGYVTMLSAGTNQTPDEEQLEGLAALFSQISERFPELKPTLDSLLDRFLNPDVPEEGEAEPTAIITAELVEPLTEYFISQETVSSVFETLAVTTTEAQMQKTILTKVGELIGKLMSKIASAFNVDQSKIASAFQFDLSEEELMRLFETMSASGVEKNADTNLMSLGYQDMDDPSSISFYFEGFEAKELFVDFLEEYNEKMEEIDEDKVVKYTDLTGFLMSSVKTIVDSVSYVLIAFVSISLVVSSIMIGIITYISVLERTKEIGVLRAIGASKKNISSIFNAETFIVGLCSGLLGIVVTLSLVPPINYVIHSVTDNYDINAVLPVQGAVTLVVLSVILTLIGGLIPSKQAAKKDPVLALRSE